MLSAERGRSWTPGRDQPEAVLNDRSTAAESWSWTAPRAARWRGRTSHSTSCWLLQLGWAPATLAQPGGHACACMHAHCSQTQCCWGIDTRAAGRGRMHDQQQQQHPTWLRCRCAPNAIPQCNLMLKASVLTLVCFCLPAGVESEAPTGQLQWQQPGQGAHRSRLAGHRS